MKNLLITGSYPPNICGVGDYTHCLMNEANENWILYYRSNWGITSFKAKIKEIKSTHCNNIILQYPTLGYGWSLLPQFLLLYFSLFTDIKCYVALHEFSQRTLKAKLATLLFFISSKIIFTSDYERLYAVKHFGLPKNRTTVINILSNIPAEKELKKWNERNIDIAYFGHLRPNKGLEDFLTTIECISHKKNNLNICIIGQKLPDYEHYIDNLFSHHKYLNIKFLFNADIQTVQKTLNDSKITFLPFPDGISERRGSFLAAISNGSLVVSYKGKFTTDSLKKVFIQTSSNNANEKILNLLNKYNNSYLEQYQYLCNDYLNNSLPKSWDEIVHLYEKFTFV